MSTNKRFFGFLFLFALLQLWMMDVVEWEFKPAERPKERVRIAMVEEIQPPKVVPPPKPKPKPKKKKLKKTKSKPKPVAATQPVMIPKEVKPEPVKTAEVIVPPKEFQDTIPPKIEAPPGPPVASDTIRGPDQPMQLVGLFTDVNAVDSLGNYIPNYPDEGRHNDLEAKIWIDLLVGPEGKVVEYKGPFGKGHWSFHRSIYHSIPDMRFPVKKNKKGQVVAYWTKKTWDFKLEQKFNQVSRSFQPKQAKRGSKWY